MYDYQRIGANIRGLRIANRETQEQLGAVLHVEKNTVSSYETGTRRPSKETLSNIAEHYLISFEELVFSDFSDIGKITIDPTAICKNIELVLPIITSENAEKNKHFNRALRMHKELYDGLHRLSYEGIDGIDVCIDEYEEALNDKNIKPEAAANIIAICFLLMFSFKSTEMMKNDRPAVIMQFAKKDRKLRDFIETPDPDYETASKEMFALMENPEFKEEITELQLTLKQSFQLSDLCDYYLALQYLWGLVDNDLTPSFNRRVGMEMLVSFITVGNSYAADFLQLCQNAAGRSGSQRVNNSN